MKFSGVVVLLFAAVLGLSAVTVDPAKAEIVVDSKADGVVQFAAVELQKYVKTITGKKMPIVNKRSAGKYGFLMGTPANVKLKPEEAVWEVGEKETRLYGDSTPTETNKILLSRVLSVRSRSGDLTAVYAFLEQQLGVLFKAPGPLGLSYTPAAVLKLKEGKYNWVPAMTYRYLWPDRNQRGARRYDNKKGWQEDKKLRILPAEFIPATKAEYEKKMFETLLWLKQQRMGRSEHYSFGHSFTRWWAMYGKNHPEYFALVQGKRQPRFKGMGNRVKMCVSNPALWKQIVANWAKNPQRGRFINICENDSGNYCECKNCRALDMPPRPGKKWDDDLSDRYIYFANNVLKEARKIDPNVAVCHYAYGVYRYPPRREKVDPSVYIGFVPSLAELEELPAMYENWYKAGVRKIWLRPNDFHFATPLPMGFEKRMFETFKVGIKYGVIGTSYDSLQGFWDIAGLGDYLIARGNVDPSKDYEHWMKEFCSIYGDAAPEVRAYHDFWRVNIWEKRLWPNRKVIGERGRYGNFRRGLMWDVFKYYSEKDFDFTDGLIKKGLKKNLNPVQRRHLEQLLLANTHARVTYRAMAAQGKAKARAAVALLKFRRANKDKLNINWERLNYVEMSSGDATGTKAAYLLSDYDDFAETSVAWFFKPDPRKEGEKDKWEKRSFKEIRKNWTRIRVDTQWENQKRHGDPKFRKFMENYDGWGYYAHNLRIDLSWKGKEVGLLFGAVDESAWVWVNGKYAGKRLYVRDPDWNTPFVIDITDQIDWTKKSQLAVVRVEDKRGAGGIWRGVMLVVRDKKKK